MSGFDNMSGKYALVFYPGHFFDDCLDRFLYAVCSGQVMDPLGLYFKWLQYEGEDQIDSKTYLMKDWKIIWIPHKLSDDQVMSLGVDRCLAQFTGKLPK